MAPLIILLINLLITMTIGISTRPMSGACVMHLQRSHPIGILELTEHFLTTVSWKNHPLAITLVCSILPVSPAMLYTGTIIY